MIRFAPRLHNLPAGDAEDVDPAPGHFLAGRRNALPLAHLRASGRPDACRQIAIHGHLVDSEAQIGECRVEERPAFREGVKPLGRVEDGPNGQIFRTLIVPVSCGQSFKMVFKSKLILYLSIEHLTFVCQ